MARKTEKQVLKTRKKLIDAARMHFLSESVGYASLENIAASAGVTRGAIYSQFPQGKKDLFEAVCQDLEQKIHDEKKELKAQIDFNLEAFLQWWLMSVHENGWLRQKIELDFQKALIYNDEQCHDQKNHKISEIFEELLTLIKQSQEQQKIKADLLAQNLAIQLVSMLMGISVMLHFQNWSQEQIKAGENALGDWLKNIKTSGDER